MKRLHDRSRPPATAEELAWAVLGPSVEDVRASLRIARSARDPERTHDLRVAVRKLRVALWLFAPLLAEARLEPIREELRWLFRALGPVREHDVLLESLRELEPEAALYDALVAQRKRAERAARRALSSVRARKLLRALRSLVSVLHGDEQHAAKKWARKRLDKRREAVRVLHEREGRDEESRHELRKRVKKLRYAAEALGTLWPKKRVKRYLAPLERLQDVLGHWNDGRVAARLLRECAEPLGDDAVHAAERLSVQVAGDTEKLEKQLHRRLDDFQRASSFWKKGK